jgi:hypothetical protein
VPEVNRSNKLLLLIGVLIGSANSRGPRSVLFRITGQIGFSCYGISTSYYSLVACAKYARNQLLATRNFRNPETSMQDLKTTLCRLHTCTYFSAIVAKDATSTPIIAFYKCTPPFGAFMIERRCIVSFEQCCRLSNFVEALERYSFFRHDSPVWNGYYLS